MLERECRRRQRQVVKEPSPGRRNVFPVPPARASRRRNTYERRGGDRNGGLWTRDHGDGDTDGQVPRGRLREGGGPCQALGGPGFGRARGLRYDGRVADAYR